MFWLLLSAHSTMHNVLANACYVCICVRACVLHCLYWLKCVMSVYRTKSISPPPSYCFLVGAVTGCWFNIYLLVKGVVVGEITVFEQCER